MRRELRLIGSPVLRERAREVDPDSDGPLIAGLLEDMWRILSEKEGLGLAAPQAGESVRVFVIDPRDDLSLRGHSEFLNPVLTLSGPEERFEEGCLSIPGVYEHVRRPSRIVVEALDREGRPFRLELEGLAARAVQHEYDHLDGILFIDRLSPVRRRLLRSRLSRLREEASGGSGGS